MMTRREPETPAPVKRGERVPGGPFMPVLALGKGKYPPSGIAEPLRRVCLVRTDENALSRPVTPRMRLVTYWKIEFCLVDTQS